MVFNRKAVYLVSAIDITHIPCGKDGWGHLVALVDCLRNSRDALYAGTERHDRTIFQEPEGRMRLVEEFSVLRGSEAGHRWLDSLAQRGKAASISGVPFPEAVSAKTSGISGLISGEHYMGLEETVKTNVAQHRLLFKTILEDGITNSLFIFIAVETPLNGDRSADLRYVAMSPAKSGVPWIIPKPSENRI